MLVHQSQENWFMRIELLASRITLGKPAAWLISYVVGPSLRARKGYMSLTHASGWEELADGEGNTYYYHEATATSQWECPWDEVLASPPDDARRSSHDVNDDPASTGTPTPSSTDDPPLPASNAPPANLAPPGVSEYRRGGILGIKTPFQAQAFHEAEAFHVEAQKERAAGVVRAKQKAAVLRVEGEEAERRKVRCIVCGRVVTSRPIKPAPLDTEDIFAEYLSHDSRKDSWRIKGSGRRVAVIHFKGSGKVTVLHPLPLKPILKPTCFISTRCFV